MAGIKLKNVRVFRKKTRISVPKTFASIPARIHTMKLGRMERNINRICDQLNRCLSDLENSVPEERGMEILRDIEETQPTIEIPKSFRI